eukprot:3489052-Rhodomonas_salina.2
MHGYVLSAKNGQIKRNSATARVVVLHWWHIRFDFAVDSPPVASSLQPGSRSYGQRQMGACRGTPDVSIGHSVAN